MTRSPFDRVFGRPSFLFAWAVLAVALLHPPHGTGVPICMMKSTTGLPCPGCGLTRSVSCAARGMLTESWAYHPFGPALLALVAGIAVVGLLPAATRARLRAGIERRRALANGIYFTAVGTFIAFGVVRVLSVTVLT